MRTFKCSNCGHSWQLAHGAGGRGVDLTCPECGNSNIHRAEEERGWGRRLWGRRAEETASIRGEAFGRGRGRGGRRGGRRW